MGNHITTVIEVDLEYIPVEPMINYKAAGINSRSQFDFFHIKLNFSHYLSLHRLEPRLPILIRSLHQTACCRRRHLLDGTRPTRRFLSTFFSCIQTSTSLSVDDYYPLEDLISFARDLDGEFVSPNPYRAVELSVKIVLLSQLTVFEPTPAATVPELIKSTPDLKRVRELDEYDDDDPKRQRMGSCRICLEDIGNDFNNCGTAAAAALPCGHSYHQNCIAFWLRNSHLCPLCRYPMPASLPWE